MTPSTIKKKRRANGLGFFRLFIFWAIMIRVMHGFLVVLYRFKGHGQENVPKQGSLIFVANHQSNFDPVIVGCIVRTRPFKGIARSTLFESKILGIYLRCFGVISINRGESDILAIRKAMAELELGGCVLIFPEGTRSPDGSIREFQRGLWLLLKKSKSTIVPVGIDGAYDAYPLGSKPKLRGRIEAIVGTPIEASVLLPMGEEVATEHVRSLIEDLRQQCQKNIASRSKK